MADATDVSETAIYSVDGATPVEVTAEGALSVAASGRSTGGFWPSLDRTLEPSFGPNEASPTYYDSAGNLRTRGPVTTDEGSVREDFTGASLVRSLTGTVTLTNGLWAIVGSGTSFLSELSHYDYVKFTAAGESLWAQVSSVLSDTEATLVEAYPGATNTGAAHTAPGRTITGTGGSFSVANSALAVAAGTTANAQTALVRDLDYGPLVINVQTSLSQRIANQTFYVGLQDAPASPSNYARFVFSGTSNTAVTFESAGVRPGFLPAASDVETTTIALTEFTTAVPLMYRIEVLVDRVKAYIDDVLFADHKVHLPQPYAVLSQFTGVLNGAVAPASNTNLVVDMVAVANFDRLQVLPAEVSQEPDNWTLSGTSAANVAVSVTRAAPNGGRSNYVTAVVASYSTSGAIGILTITDGAGKTYLSQYVSTAGNGVMSFPEHLRIDPGQSVIATLAAAGGGVIGKVNLVGETR